MQNDFYVYVLFRPDGTPCYVGKGKGRRWIVHERGKYGYKNPRLVAIIKQAGGTLPKRKVAEGLSENDAFALERRLIAEYGRGDKGPLVNFTDGGEGTSGIVISAERRAATSRRHKGKTLSAEHKAATLLQPRIGNGRRNRGKKAAWPNWEKRRILKPFSGGVLLPKKQESP